MPQIKNALFRYRIIDSCLRNKFKPFPTKDDLREACEESLFGDVEGKNICNSTIEKDLFALRMEHDAPIKYSKIEKGYYYADPEFTLAENPLTPEDMEAIEFAAKTLLQFKNNDMFKQFGSAIDKIADRVTVSKAEDVDAYIQFETAQSSGGSEFIADILAAIKQRNLIEFDYGKFTEEDFTTRTVLPLLLKQYRNRWYLVSFEENKKDYRTFALDRIDDIRLLKQQAERPKNFNPDLFFKHSVGITSGNVQAERIVLRATALASKYLDSLPIHESQRIVELNKDGSASFELNVAITEELIRELMSYGGSVIVDAPLSLKKEVKFRAQRILNS